MRLFSIRFLVLLAFLLPAMAAAQSRRFTVTSIASPGDTVARVVMICMPFASPAMRAAMLTVSPNTSLFSSITGPQ